CAVRRMVASVDDRRSEKEMDVGVGVLPVSDGPHLGGEPAGSRLAAGFLRRPRCIRKIFSYHVSNSACFGQLDRMASVGHSSDCALRFGLARTRCSGAIDGIYSHVVARLPCISVGPAVAYSLQPGPAAASHGGNSARLELALSDR